MLFHIYVSLPEGNHHPPVRLHLAWAAWRPGPWSQSPPVDSPPRGNAPAVDRNGGATVMEVSGKSWGVAPNHPGIQGKYII